MPAGTGGFAGRILSVSVILSPQVASFKFQRLAMTKRFGMALAKDWLL
jgi:hypothetical protein